MRIISKFRDFYDGVMRTGMDRDVVYVREEKKVSTTEDFGVNFDTQDSGSSYRSYRGYSVKLLFLGYCGQIMRVMDLKYEVKDPNYINPVEVRRVFFDFNEFKDFMLENKLARDWDFDNRRWYHSKFEKYRDADTKKMQEIFHRFQTPLFLLTHVSKYASKGTTTIHLGPRLQALDFHKFKDPYTTYQDIFQYVSGVLNHPETKMVKISDKDKIHKHGFDKWSFRQKGPKK